MAILSNQGKTIPELQFMSSGDLNSSDLLIIQDVSSNATKRTSISNFVIKSAELFTGFNNLKFNGPNNQFTGSIRNFEADNYSVIGSNIPNILRRLRVLDFIEIGGNTTVNSSMNVFSKNVNFLQSGGGSVFYEGDNSASTLDIVNYAGGVTFVNSPLSVDSITATLDPGFYGNLQGDVDGDINSTGSSGFNEINVTTANIDNGIIVTATISGGSINNTPIGDAIVSTISGSKITATNKFFGDIDGNLVGDTVDCTVLTATNITTTDITGTLTGNVVGNLTGDVYSATNVKVLENGSGGVATAAFYGTASYARNGNKFSAFSASYAQRSSTNISSSFATRAISASFASSTNASSARTASFLNWTSTRKNGTSSYSFNGIGNYSSYSSSYALTSTFASSSVFALTSRSSSHATRADSVAGTVQNAVNAITAINCTTALTSSFLRKGVNRTNHLAYFDGTRLSNFPLLSYSNVSDVQILNFSRSNWGPGLSSRMYFVIDSKPVNSNPTFAQSAFVLSQNFRNRQSNKPGFIFGPEQWTFLIADSGSLSIQSYTGSYNFTNPRGGFVAKGAYPYMNMMTVKNNVMYFWPDIYSYSSISRDASVAIGLGATDVQPWEQPPTKARLHISVFSASVNDLTKGAWDGDASVRKLDAAIYVEYGSSSFTTQTRKTFVVSGSGNIYTRGNLIVDDGITGSYFGVPNIWKNNTLISFYGTSSNALSSSYSRRTTTSSYALAAKSSSYVLDAATAFLNHVGNYNYTIIPSVGGNDESITTITANPGQPIRYFKMSGTVITTQNQSFTLYGLKIKNTLLTSNVFSSIGWGNTVAMTGNNQLNFTIEGIVPSGLRTGNLDFALNYGTTKIGDPVIYAYVIGSY